MYTNFVNATVRFFGADFIADQITPYDHFTIRYKKINDNNFSFKSITAAHIAAGGRNIGGLSYLDEYEWGIRTFCGVTSTWKSPWKSGPNFIQSNSSKLNNPVQEFNVFPNPSSDVFNIRFESQTKQNINIKVVDVIGEIIFEQEKKNFEGYYSESINMKNKAKGVYFLHITNDNIGIKKKLIIQ